LKRKTQSNSEKLEKKKVLKAQKKPNLNLTCRKELGKGKQFGTDMGAEKERKKESQTHFKTPHHQGCHRHKKRETLPAAM